jgi:hypothetical protein
MWKHLTCVCACLRVSAVNTYNKGKVLKKILYITTLLLGLVPVHGLADVIYLKDGTKIETTRVWEEGGFIRFYLQDYEDIIITYSKEIVERIEKGQAKSKTGQPKKVDQISDHPKKAVPDKADRPEIKAKSSESAPPTSPEDKTAGLIQNRQMAVTIKPQKSGLQQPPAQKANKLDNTGQVQVEVRPQAKLTQPSASTANAGVTKSNPVDGILFYNPRRTYKYWAGVDSKHHTLKEAVDALAKKFDRRPQWVEEHLGNTNDLGDIYRNLAQIDEHPQAQIKTGAVPKGALFYDPRRPYKYWAGETSRHRTLDQALTALAKKYDRSPEWIKDHLGETNDLTEIHQNLLKSKVQEESM